MIVIFIGLVMLGLVLNADKKKHPVYEIICYCIGFPLFCLLSYIIAVVVAVFENDYLSIIGGVFVCMLVSLLLGIIEKLHIDISGATDARLKRLSVYTITVTVSFVFCSVWLIAEKNLELFMYFVLVPLYFVITSVMQRYKILNCKYKCEQFDARLFIEKSVEPINKKEESSVTDENNMPVVGEENLKEVPKMPSTDTVQNNTSMDINGGYVPYYPPVEPEKPEGTQNQHKVMFVAALILGFMFSVCFAGWSVRASLSSLVFYNLASVGVYFVLKLTDLLKRKAVIVYAVPVFILSAFNAYFEYSSYNIFNSLAFLVLLAIMLIRGAGLDDAIRLDTLLGVLLPRAMFAPYHCAKACLPQKGGVGKNIGKVMLGFSFSIPVLFIIAALLSSGDDAFSDFIQQLFSVDISEGIYKIIIAFAAFLYICAFLYRAVETKKRISFKPHNGDGVISIAFITPVNLLFLFFCYSQLKYIGDGVSISDFTTYARFAREGFFELLIVTFINFAIIFVYSDILKNYGNVVLKSSLCLLCVFTFVLIISSASRMYFYIKEYGFTTLRMEVVTFLAMESVLVFITLYKLIKRKTELNQSFIIGLLITLFVLNITARPEFSVNLNRSFAKDSTEYTSVNYYTHSSVPILIDKFYSSSSQKEKYEICAQIKKLYNGSNENNEGKWQNISIQESNINSLIKEFKDKNDEWFSYDVNSVKNTAERVRKGR